MVAAQASDLGNPAYANAPAVFYAQQGRWCAGALYAAEALQEHFKQASYRRRNG